MTFFSCKGPNGFDLVSYDHSTCDKTSNPFRLVDRITSKGVENGKLSLTIGYKENCCLNFKPKTTFEDDTLRISLIPQDNIACACECCYETTFIFNNVTDTSFVTMFQGKIVTLNLEKYMTSEPTFEILGNDTFNVTNKYGARSGIWKTFDENKHLTSETLYKPDNDARSNMVWSQDYFSNGKVRSKLTFSKGIVEEFYESGQLKKKCKSWRVTNGNTSISGDSCKFYNSKGQEIPKLDEEAK